MAADPSAAEVPGTGTPHSSRTRIAFDAYDVNHA
jgi:hypothetical protein